MSTALCLAGGTIAFLLFLASDVCILRRWKGARACFTLGGILLAGGTLGLLCGAGIPAAFRERPVAAAISAAGACASLGVLIHVLFFALPEEAYRTGGRTVKTGWYALCRHPGVLWFGALYVCLAALVCTGEMLVRRCCLPALMWRMFGCRIGGFSPKHFRDTRNTRLLPRF